MILALLFVFIPYEVKAETDTGYYYQNLHVEVEVNEAREYKIIEYMDVYFEEDMHGIIRSIPTYSNVEKYTIEDIFLKGAEYEVNNEYSNIEIKIGSADKLVNGLQHYELHYTIKHYQDYDETHDYMYLNVLGDDYDTYIENFSSTITFAPSLQIEDYTITSGPYSSKDNLYVDGKIEDQVITLQNNQRIPSYRAVTIQVQLPQGAFSQAPEYKFPYVINDAKIDMVITDELIYHIKQEYTVTSSLDTYMYIDFDIDDSYERGIYSDVMVKANCEYYASDGYASFRLKQGFPQTFSIEYTMRPKSLKAKTEYYFVTGYDDTKVEHLEINLEAPIIPDYTLRYNRSGDTMNPERYELKETSTTMHLESKGTIQAGEQVSLKMSFPEGTFYRPLDTQYKITTILAVVLGIIAIIMKLSFGNKHHLIAPVTFYPPNNMNSAEVGYVYDDVCSNEDITSLLFLWASKGYLKIHQATKTTYSFERMRDITIGEVPIYEHELFNATFAYGEGNVVDKNDLKGAYYQDVNRAIKAIKKKYSKSDALYSKSINVTKYILAALSLGILLFMITYPRSFKYGYLAGLVIALIENVFLIASVGMLLILLPSMKKWNVLGRISGIVGLGCLIGVSLLINRMYLDGHVVIILGTMFLCIFDFIVFLSLRKFSSYGAELKGQILGFKEFLVKAEKEQLEALLNEDPEYYYHILPYAQSLGVTKLWRKKFKDLTMPPPSYYDGVDVSYVAFNRMCDTVSRSYSSAMNNPKSSSSSSDGSSGYSGGGGGFSGGGSSGGGSGGGGSRGW